MRSPRRPLLVASLVLLGGLALYLAAWPTPVRPVAWQAPAGPPMDRGPYAVNDRLRGVERLPDVGLEGPEYVEVDGEGRLWTGYAGGAIYRFAADGTAPRRVADTRGRPLGLRVLADGRLVVADAARGLLLVDTSGAVRVLVDRTHASAPNLVDDVAVTADGAHAWFTDASRKFGLGDHVLDLIEHGPNGRLMRYDMATGAVTTLLDSLHFANGVAMGPGGRYLLVSETGGYRVLRYWLAGDRAGRVEPFAENLPGFPDNITFDGRDRFWVAIVSPRNALMDRLAPWPAVRRSVARLPAALRPKPVAHAIVLAFDTTGRLVENLQDAGPGAYAPLTTVREADGWLYLGSLTGRAIGRIRAPDRR